MTKQLEQAIAKVRTLPEDRQDEAAALLMSVVEQDPAAIQLNAAQIAEVEARLADTEPQYALHEKVRALFQPGATQPGPESTDLDYLAWKARKIGTAVKQANDKPDDTYTHEQVFEEIKQKFRP